MWTHSPEAALQIATGLHRERIARAEQLRLARRGRPSQTTTAPPLRHQPLSRLIIGTGRVGRVAADFARRSTRRHSSVSTPCPTGAC